MYSMRERTDVRTLRVCLQQRSSKVTWNYTWNLTLRRWIVIRFDCSTAGKQLWFRRRAESTQIQDLLMPRNNSPPNSPWERNHAKIHKYNLCAFCSPSRSTTFESLTCQSHVARQYLSNLIACRTWFKSLIETPCFSRDFVELNSWI